MNVKPASREHQDNDCYLKTYDSTNGIRFIWKEKAEALFAPYSFLSHVWLKGGDTLTLEYSFGKVTVSGQAMDKLFQLISDWELYAVIEQSRPAPSKEAWVKKIRFESLRETSAIEPVFPDRKY